MDGNYITGLLANLVVYMVVWLFAVSAHEAAHAWTSLKFGDDTAKALGRVTLNPIPHIDPIGTLLLPIIGFLLSYTGSLNGIPLIAWGKPTPVNPLLWRNKDVANICVSGAGIVTNLLIAVAASTLIKVLIWSQFFTRDSIETGLTQPLFMILYSSVILNVGLAIFNLLPFPPLDGSKILQTFLPKSMEPLFELLEKFGFIILLVLIQMGVIRVLVTPLRDFILSVLF